MPLSKVQKERLDFHLEDNPDCSYPHEPHYVSGTRGKLGYWLCDPPPDALVEKPEEDSTYTGDLRLERAAMWLCWTADPIDRFGAQGWWVVGENSAGRASWRESARQLFDFIGKGMLGE